MSARSVQVFGQEENGQRQGPATVDRVSKNLVFIDIIHHHIHDGDMFQADRLEEGVANDGTVEMLIKVPAGGVAHASFTAQAGGDARLQLFEGPTITADGTPVTPVNRNRTSTKVSAVSVFHTPTTSAAGTPLPDKLIAGGSGGNSAGGQTEPFAEWNLKADEDYLFRITNISGVAQNIGLEVDFYDPLAAAP